MKTRKMPGGMTQKCDYCVLSSDCKDIGKICAAFTLEVVVKEDNDEEK